MRTFKRGVSEELMTRGVHQAIRTVAGLRDGRTSAREELPGKAVPAEDVEAIKARVSRQVRAIIQLQNLTVMRPGEAVILRAGDLPRSGDLWIYKPSRHKAGHHDLDREIYIGLRGCEILDP